MRKERILTDAQKEAARLRAKQWYWENREKSLESNRVWRKENAERHRQNSSAYFLANKEKCMLANAERRNTNPEREAEYQKQYRKTNAERIAEYRRTHREERLVVQNNRRAKVLFGGVLPSNIISTLMKLQKGRCANCHVDLIEAGKHLDHIVPVSKGGLNVQKNVELLCPTCNLKKKAKDPIDWARQNGRLL